MQIQGSNRFGDFNESFDIEIDAIAPLVDSIAASEVGSSSARLNAMVKETGGRASTLSFEYGQSENVLSQSTVSVTVDQPGEISFLLTDLNKSTTYFFKPVLSNSAGQDSENETFSFTTGETEVPPVVTLHPPTDPSGTEITLNYELLSYDSVVPSLTLYWGAIDQGELAGLWESSHEIGLTSEIGSGSYRISGLDPGSNIFFQIRATTPNYDIWAEESISGRSIGLPVVEVLPVLDQQANSANLTGEVVSTGGVLSSVFLPQPRISDNLRAHWRFDEGIGSETSDSVGLSGKTWVRPGVSWQSSHQDDFKEAISLNGETLSYVELGGGSYGGITRQNDLLAWFNFDEESGEEALNLGMNGSPATLMNGATFSTTVKKFGESSLHIPTNRDRAYAKVQSPIYVGPNNSSDRYSISTWFRDLYPSTTGRWRTLTRGSSANHQVIVHNNNDSLGTHTGWIDSGYDLPASASSGIWQHIVATFDGTSTRFYLDGSLVGQLTGSKGNDIRDIGSYSGNDQRFAQYLDDFRIYGLTLSNSEVASIYNDGLGDLPLENDPLLLGGEMTLSGWYKIRKFEPGLRVLDFGSFGKVSEFNSIILSTAGTGADANLTVNNGTEHSSLIFENVWKAHEWQHLAISIAADGQTKLYSNGEFKNSMQGVAPLKVRRSHHVIGGNRLWMDTFEPSDIEGMKLWLDAEDEFTLDKGSFLADEGIPQNGETLGFWGDKSGNGNHAVKFSDSNPKWDVDGFNGMPCIDLINDSFYVQNSEVAFDGWSELTLFATLYQTTFDEFCVVLGKSNHTKWADSNSHPFAWTLNMHRADYGGHRIWGPAFNTSTGGNSYPHTNSDAIWSSGVNANFTGGPSIITLRYSSNYASKNLIFRINGSTHKTANLSGPIKPEPEIPVSIGSKGDGSEKWNGRISEIFIFNKDLADSEIDTLEGYLAHKWNLTEKLPQSHSFAENSPISESTGSAFFDGAVDDFRIYGRALTLQEIGSIHGGDHTEFQNVGGDDPEISIYWGLNDGESNKSAWNNSTNLGKKGIGHLSHIVSV